MVFPESWCPWHEWINVTLTCSNIITHNYQKGFSCLGMKRELQTDNPNMIVVLVMLTVCNQLFVTLIIKLHWILHCCIVVSAYCLSSVYYMYTAHVGYIMAFRGLVLPAELKCIENIHHKYSRYIPTNAKLSFTVCITAPSSSTLKYSDCINIKTL